MKGYIAFAVAFATVLVLLPMMFLNGYTDRAAEPTNRDTAHVSIFDETFSVQHTDEDTMTAVSAYDLTLYATAASVSPQAPVEAIKAQAVVCYTSFCYQRMTKEAGQADVQSTVLPFPTAFRETYWREQWGEAYDKNIAVIKQAVNAVAGKTIQYHERPIMALDHAMNAGQTENGQILLGEAIPYLVSVTSDSDAMSEQQLSTVTVSEEEATAVLRTLGVQTEDDAVTWFGDSQKTPAGTVLTMTVCQQALTGYQIQQAFSLPSASFEVSVQEKTVIFTVRGNGHFVGMSRYGAIEMAKSGKPYEEIIAHYYPGTMIQ